MEDEYLEHICILRYMWVFFLLNSLLLNDTQVGVVALKGGSIYQ